MPNRFRSRGGSLRTTVRRKSEWVGSADQGFSSIAANTNVLSQSIVTNNGETIVRVRGLISVTPQVLTADIALIGAVGMGLVSEQAAVAGAASVPGPFSENFWDGWFMHEYYGYQWHGASAVGERIASVQIPFDSKAMRKTKAGSRVVVMVESQASAVNISIQFRMLFKLP